MARKSQNNSTYSVHSGNKFDARQSWRKLEARVRRLEGKIARLEADPYEGLLNVQVGKPVQKRGPKSISDSELAKRRDELVQFFEMNWPELEPLCAPTPKFKGLKQAFEAFANPGSRPTPWGTPVQSLPFGFVGNHSAAAKRLLLPKTFSELQVFLAKEQRRFASNPRQLANALAGCPDLGFWASLKRCQRIQVGFGIDHRAMRSYIRREHPRLYQKLSASSNLAELANFLRKYRTKDLNIGGLTADHLLILWKAGMPG
ncbi:MAG: hypothetical protein JSS95_00025 [Acidobacteria bacterium]|nr:hypothetical protein [Acidobacteriota bacterium]